MTTKTPSPKFAILKRRWRAGKCRESISVGTLKELTKANSYRLECGKSWQHERGRAKISLNPRTIDSLITNLNNATENCAANGLSSESYHLVDIPTDPNTYRLL